MTLVWAVLGWAHWSHWWCCHAVVHAGIVKPCTTMYTCFGLLCMCVCLCFACFMPQKEVFNMWCPGFLFAVLFINFVLLPGFKLFICYFVLGRQCLDVDVNVAINVLFYYYFILAQEYFHVAYNNVRCCLLYEIYF